MAKGRRRRTTRRRLDRAISGWSYVKTIRSAITGRWLVLWMVLVITVAAVGGIIAQRAGISSSRQKKHNDRDVSIASVTPANPSKEYIHAGGRLIATEESTSGSCAYQITPPSNTFTAAGGSGSISVSTGTGCAWSANSSDTSWLTITSGSSGNGNGVVYYSVAQNFLTVQRSGTITIATQVFQVTQLGSSCNYSIYPTTATFQAAGGSGSFNVTADTGCSWNAASSDTSWLTITAGSFGSGNGTVSYSVTVNSGSSSRSATITVQGLIHTVTQNGTGAVCSPTISPTSQTFTSAGGTGSINVSMPSPLCSWSAIGDGNVWITITSGSSGTGNGTVNFSVAVNNGTKSRQGSIYVVSGGIYRTFSINQSPPGGGGGGGTGLTGEYFNFASRPLCGTAVLSRIDQTINFDWGTGSPAPGVNADFFQVRWTGQLEAPDTGTYTFSVRTDDGVKLWVNNQLLVDQWRNQSGSTWSNAIVLTAGQRYDIRMDMYDWTGGAEAHLWWQRPSSTTPEIVPMARLYPYSPPAINPLYEGWLEIANCTTISGWAFNRRQLNSSITVDIYADNTAIQLGVPANLFRSDLSGTNDTCDNALHGFSYTVPPSLRDGQTHSIAIRYGGTQIPLSGSPLSIACSGATPPNPPSNLSATTVTFSQINLQWTYTGSTQTGFIIQRNIDNGTYSDFATINNPNATTYSDTTLTSGHTYCYKVFAFNGAGRSSESNTACASTQGHSGGPPAAPSNLTCVFVPSPRKVDLNWVDNADNEDYFEVYRRFRYTGSTKWTPYSRISTPGFPGPNTTTFSDILTLYSGYTYSYIVRAVNSSGNSNYSNEFQVDIPLGGTYSCVSVSAFSGIGGAGSYGYSEGAGASAHWRAPSAGASGIDPVSGLNVLFVADSENHNIRMVYLEGNAAGSSILIAGSGVAGYLDGDDPYQARFNNPQGIAAVKNPSGVIQALLVADTDNQVIRRLLPPLGRNKWRVTTLSGAVGKAGYVEGDPTDAMFNGPHGIGVGLDGFIYIADTFNKAVRRVSSEGYAATWYKSPSPFLYFQPVGVAMNGITGEMYVSDQASHTIDSVTEGTLVTLAGTGGAGYADGSGTVAAFNTPYYITWLNSDQGYTLYIADLNNNRIRVLHLQKNNEVVTWAGSGSSGYLNSNCSSSQFNLPSGVGLGAGDELYVIEKGNNTVRKIQ